MTLTRAERRALVEVEQKDVSLSAQAHILSLRRSSLYYRAAPPPTSEVAAKHRIDELYLEFPYYGARRMAAQLQREGMPIDKQDRAQIHARDGLNCDLSWTEPEQAPPGASAISLPVA